MHVDKLPSGRYRASVRFQGARRRTAAFLTEDEARLAGARLMIDMGGRPSADLTVNELIDHHMLTWRYQPTTYQDLVSVIRRLRRDRPDVLTMAVRDVAPVHLDALYRELGERGWSNHRLARLHGTLLCSAFSVAATMGWTTRNPTIDVAPEAPELPDISPPTDRQVAQILAAAGKLELIVRLAATVGARLGELCALQWADVNPSARSVTVRKSISRTAHAGLHQGRGKTGTKGHRTVVIDRALVDRLEAHREAQGGVWVFSHDRGRTPWAPGYVSHAYGDLVRGLGIDTTFHQLRHYVATTALTAGVPPITVASRLGHSMATLQRRYAHFIPGTDDGIADLMASRLTH